MVILRSLFSVIAAEEYTETLTTKYWLADPILYVELVESFRAQLSPRILKISWYKVLMIRIHGPKQRQNRLVSQYQLPKWLDGIQILEVIFSHWVWLNLVYHPFFGINIKQAIISLLIVLLTSKHVAILAVPKVLSQTSLLIVPVLERQLIHWEHLNAR